MRPLIDIITRASLRIKNSMAFMIIVYVCILLGLAVVYCTRADVKVNFIYNQF
jgi:hypothetical protein